MYQATARVLTEYASVWKTISPIEETYKKLQKAIADITTEHQAQDKSLVGMTAENQQFRKELITKTLKVSAGLQAHGAEVDNKVLLEQINFAPSTLAQISSTKLLNKARQIFSLTQGLEKELGVFRVTPQHVQELDMAIEKYDTSDPDKRLATAEGKNATQKLSSLFTQTSRMLRNKLDKFLLPLASEAPDFHHKYLTARTIVHTGGSGKKRSSAKNPAPQP